ncbi:hypothetical protein POP72_024 [Pectobacterium phage POP72]|uniref:Uncharacterized protein n=1 Tax=Pectobacterium phage POP72 TaxID=1965269 RepID=A0A2R2V1Q6_9CAUD|nr:hypothetical protein POP72_024 [Pectobacterium phage POP72]
MQIKKTPTRLEALWGVPHRQLEVLWVIFWVALGKALPCSQARIGGTSPPN